jgi:hypothetical protein
MEPGIHILLIKNNKKGKTLKKIKQSNFFVTKPINICIKERPASP